VIELKDFYETYMAGDKYLIPDLCDDLMKRIRNEVDQ
jgi:hypothetical protein